MARKGTGPICTFGARVPRNTKYKRDSVVDKQNQNSLEAIAKEMIKIMEFQFYKIQSDGQQRPAYKKIPCHTVYDVKLMEEARPGSLQEDI